MYPEYMEKSIEKVNQTRSKRLELFKSTQKSGEPLFPMMSDEERQEVLDKFHPDYKPDSKKEIRIGPNKGERITSKVVDTLEAYSRINPKDFDLEHPDIETDVLVIGGGSAGFCASLLAAESDVTVTLATKLRIGDSNSMMAQGGIQAAVRPDDSPYLHYLDVMGGGHFDNKPELVKALVNDAPHTIQWLSELGVMFDRNPDGTMLTKPGGGTCRPRMHSARDYSGAGMCRVLRDEVQNKEDKINILEHQPVVELIKDDTGKVAGAILYHLINKCYITVKAKATIITTGGFGRLHIHGFETTNHYGATADGLVMAYRAGANLLYMDSVQYHPTGAVFPAQILGFLCTEKLRGLGAQPVNKDGKLFVFPLEPRDIEASAFIRECRERNMGIKTPGGQVGIWLDTPLIEQINGPGTIKKSLPAMLRQFGRFNIDITKVPMLVYPTLHYQNGGIEINDKCETKIEGLFIAGEASGGVHGRNRLMGNSQLDVMVFGKRAGKHAADYAKSTKIGKLNLDHVYDYKKEVDKLDVNKNHISPMILPDYVPERIKKRQYTVHPEGTLR